LNNFSLSVVIATFNRPELVIRAVDSVLSQRSRDVKVEIIVVDDASTTSLPVFLASDIVCCRMPINGGPGPARMQGLKLAQAPWVLMLDDDDILEPGALSYLANKLQLPDFTDYPVVQFARTNGRINSSYRLVDFDDYLSGYLTGDFTPVFNKAVFLQTGLSYPANRAGGEHLLWWRLAADYGGIPSFSRVLVKVLDDADIRMTHISSQIKNASDHQQLAEVTLAQFGDLLRSEFPAEYCRVCLARITYSLLSGRKQSARRFLAEAPIAQGLKAALWGISWLPLPIIHQAFIFYRRQQAKRCYAH